MNTRIVFELSMPTRGSWNGGWSGEKNYYAVVQTIRDRDKAEEILRPGSYSYRWSDGWSALVRVREVDATAARKARTRSQGFCGYNWMVDRIVLYGKILADHELEAAAAVVLG